MTPPTRLKEDIVLFNKFFIYIFISLLVGIIIIFLRTSKVSQEILISKNGNFLFYNSPITAKTKEYTFLAFIDNMGGVYVKKYYKDISEKSATLYKVHDYISNIKQLAQHYKSQKVRNDDHSAPAIIYDPFSQKTRLATSFHGSDLYIYEYLKEKDDFNIFKTIKGKFTYPRFIKTKNDILLFVREMYKKDTKWCGVLVMYKFSDDFTEKYLIQDTYSGSVIYASRPFYYHDIVYFTYATHDYATSNMTGLIIIGWDTKSEKLVLNLDLSSYLDKNYFYNRPTCVAVQDNQIVVATSFFDSKKNFKEEKLYIWENTVLILKVDIENKANLPKDNIIVNILHQNKTKAPYYNTDVFIDKNFNWIYFDENKTISNRAVNDKCFHHRYMMYPNIVGDSVFYATVNNDHYSIRDFNNTIIECQHYAK